MPFIRVSYMEQQYESRQLEQISQTIMEALIQHFHVPEDDLFQVFHAHKREEFFYNRNYLNIERSNGLLFIQITCKSGRTVEQKRSLYDTLATKLSTAVPMRKEDVFIVLLETEFEDWSFGNGVAQMLQRREGREVSDGASED
ncbi:tautomerase family protein [Paenibacillus paeoniae]|uniref:Tautomerase family protein n=1 Tax=Paenibacillus paeoniae TaxID=2292705 RepID=A0A371PH40_9BACL|nr:tautomerase family protein [Paenibacillus paeoniae]REK75175.1 tautomerase family protein [Paenibacillus paeoniae]